MSLSTRVLQRTSFATRAARDILPPGAKVLYRKAKRRLQLARYVVEGNSCVDEDYALRILDNLEARFPRHCPVCGFVGDFDPYGLPPRCEAQCPECGSLERHRLLAHMDRLHGIFANARALLHFAPEPLLSAILREACPGYVSADIADPNADVRLDIEEIEVTDGTFDTVLCSHVLEHVDDRKALRELHRILTPYGRLVVMVPVADGCTTTYENPDIRDPAGRQAHFGQWDHLRVYGADVRDRLAAAGFEVTEYTAEGADAVRHRLRMGEKIFVCDKI